MIIVDTTVLVDIERGHAGIEEAFLHHRDEQFFVSAMSLKEIHVGLGYTRARLGDDAFNKKKNNLDVIMEDFHVLDVTNEILVQSGLREGALLAAGTPVDIEDIVIGTTAEMAGASAIFTRNPGHFASFHVPIKTYAVPSTGKPRA